MLKTHVLADLNSAQPLLKVRACWVYGEFCDYEFNDSEHIRLVIEGIYSNLTSEMLPVKFAAALALSKMLNNATAIELLKPFLGNTLEVYLRIMDEIDSDELIGSLEVIMEKY